MSSKWKQYLPPPVVKAQTAHKLVYPNIFERSSLLFTSAKAKRVFGIWWEIHQRNAETEAHTCPNQITEMRTRLEWTCCQCKQHPPLRKYVSMRNSVYHLSELENPSSLWPHNCSRGKCAVNFCKVVRACACPVCAKLSRQAIVILKSPHLYRHKRTHNHASPSKTSSLRRTSSYVHGHIRSLCLSQCTTFRTTLIRK